MSNVIPKFASDSTLQLTVPATTAVSLLSLLVAAGEDETQMKKVNDWSIDVEGVLIRGSSNGNLPTPTVGTRMKQDSIFGFPNTTADLIMLVSGGVASKINVSIGVLAKGFA